MPMIEVVTANVRPKAPHRFIFLALHEHLQDTQLRSVLERAAPDCSIISVDQITQGAACTVLLARDAINNEDQLMIVNSDQWVDVDIDDYLCSLDQQNADGLIMTMWSDHPKWSYVRFDQHGRVCELVEKRVVSNEATVGIYNFRDGRAFVRAAEQMIKKNLRVNNEFYVAPVYNELIAEGKMIVVFNVGKEFDGMYGMGIPEDLERFLTSKVSLRAVRVSQLSDD